MSMSGFSPFGGSKPIKLLKDHEQFFIEKPPFPANLDDDPSKCKASIYNLSFFPSFLPSFLHSFISYLEIVCIELEEFS